MTTLTQDPQLNNSIDKNIDNQTPASTITQPGQIRVIRRNGRITAYDDTRIITAIKKAFIDVEGNSAANSNRIHDIATQLTQQISALFKKRRPDGGTIHIEEIQDKVELALMYAGEHATARAYVLYREKRHQEREAKAKAAAAITGNTTTESTLSVTLPTGEKVPLDNAWLYRIISSACENLEDVEPQKIWEDTQKNLFDGVPLKEVYKAPVMCARTQVEIEPNYSFVTARLLLHDLYRETLEALDIPYDFKTSSLASLYGTYFKTYIEKGIELGLLHSNLLKFDLEKISQALLPERDQQFTYLGLQTLYDRYFIHHQQTRIELPQAFFMRIAMGLAEREGENRNDRAIEFYRLLSAFDFMCSTPTLFNAGTLRPQLSSCFLSTVSDSLDSIYNLIKNNALLSKFAGGLGNDWTPIRAMGAYIKGTNGKSQGIVPFLNVADATLIAVNQGGRRKGAGCAYLETWHLDIEEFLDLRKNTGDDRRRTHDMNTANWVPDLFMKRVFENADWTLFSPDETPDLHDLYGEAFEQAYTAYEVQSENKKIRGKKVKAVTLWRKMLGMLFETGHPWITFKDPCNLRSPQQHTGIIHSSNLCTEITLNTSEDEIAVCNLGSINLVNHTTPAGLNSEKLATTIKTAIRMLDNVIDINHYTVPQAKHSNLRHRPIGMGIMGFQDALYIQKIPYASDAAVEFADRSMEHISYHAINASTILAKERGPYESYEGSLWSQGILPIDSIERLAEARGKYFEQDQSSTLDWDIIRQRVLTRGMRNSNVMAIAPTATISNICGVSQSIEPTYQNLFVKSNMSGEFTIVNSYLVSDLKALDLWDAVMAHDLKYYNGSLSRIDRIPAELKHRYATAFEIEPRWLIDAASRRQKWLDQSQSLNLYMDKPSGKKLDVMYRMAWVRGLKTTYYLRSMGASNTEKATLYDGALNAVNMDTQLQLCSIDNPDCEACQ